ncbi:hypothetical protein [Anaerococcus tetradius]|uniref:Uncharacterized protein n=1 Tax=Anaerococcus tetradius TaxID=33036 RepID=A0A133KFC6_9FIRM|nr:hypothetical protein [Anaerococcus tetradius]KWZ78134.1 hypothetical protein HMPREF3200_00933 [Anaerococcus tetradius]
MDSKTNGFLSRFFHLDKNNTNVKTEIIAGITTFITIAYVLIINPQVLATPFNIMGDASMAEKVSNGVFIGTCLGAFIGTILVALYAKLPFAQAPGMGLSAFFAYYYAWNGIYISSSSRYSFHFWSTFHSNNCPRY